MTCECGQLATATASASQEPICDRCKSLTRRGFIDHLLGLKMGPTVRRGTRLGRLDSTVGHPAVVIQLQSAGLRDNSLRRVIRGYRGY